MKNAPKMGKTLFFKKKVARVYRDRPRLARPVGGIANLPRAPSPRIGRLRAIRARVGDYSWRKRRNPFITAGALVSLVASRDEGMRMCSPQYTVWRHASSGYSLDVKDRSRGQPLLRARCFRCIGYSYRHRNCIGTVSTAEDPEGSDRDAVSVSDL